MLTEFYLAIEQFSQELSNFNSSVNDIDFGDHRARSRMHACGHDIRSHAELFSRAHIAANMWTIDDLSFVATYPRLSDPSLITKQISDPDSLSSAERRLIQEHQNAASDHLQQMINRGKSLASQRKKESTDELLVCYKSYFYFIRSFQDAAYAVLQDLFSNKTTSKSSMFSCINGERGPVFEIVSKIDGYTAWFRKFRDLRNRVKEGTSSGLSGPFGDIGISLHMARADGGVVVSASDRISISDITTAVTFSARLVSVVHDTAIKRKTKEQD